jgi:hypothetical protein
MSMCLNRDLWDFRITTNLINAASFRSKLAYIHAFWRPVRGRVGLQCKARSGCWDCAQEKRGLVTESPAR